MDTNRIKKFATEARNILKQGIAAKIQTLGFDKTGRAPEQLHPIPVQGGTIWNGRTETERFYDCWKSLYARIQKKGITEVYEEAAYTWFNRLMAIRILQKNGLASPVLDFVDTAYTPRIVDEARAGQIPAMPEAIRMHLAELLDDDSKTTEQFALLITAWCHNTPIIERCFGAIADYTELLLPNNILSAGGFMDLLNHTEFITDEEFQSPELIGWLYQFYISERKDEVFAKKGKFEADEIPAATQIFTPNWIVKYMVQNTVGRIYLDNNPYATECKNRWNYLVETEPTPEANKYRYTELTELKVADLACGSGHILNECFDILYQLYIAEGYTRAEAIENIFRCNLTGIDIDTRAQQLACFALLLKACQKERSFANAHLMPHVLTIPKPFTDDSERAEQLFPVFFNGCETQKMVEELTVAFKLMNDADSLGSIMKFTLTDTTRYAVTQAVNYWLEQSTIKEEAQRLLPAMQLLLALTETYSAIVMNPPYMGGGNMNATLAKYVKDNYEEGKADLCTVFIQVAQNRCFNKGSYAFIIPPSWLFLSTFESLRRSIVKEQSIHSMLHLSRGVFGADFGAVTSIIQNHKDENARGTYFRLVERTFQEFDQKHLRMLFEQTLEDPMFKYYFKDYSKEVKTLPHSDNGNQIYYPNIPQKNFEKIPGNPIGYWLGNNMILAFRLKSIDSIAQPKSGLATGDNATYQRYWSEVSLPKIGFLYKDVNETDNGKHKWFPCNSGGTLRKWGCNNELVVNWESNGCELKNFRDAKGKLASRPQNTAFYFKEGLTWNKISSGNLAVKHKIVGSIYDDTSRSAFVEDSDQLLPLIGLLCSNVALSYLKVFNPTMSFTNNDISRIPVSNEIFNNTISQLVSNSVLISRQDWDAHETSWDFETNELVRLAQEGLGEISASINGEEAMRYHSLSLLYQEYKTLWSRNFMQLHRNEEELNRQFIEIYDLQEELTPDVPLSEITILQQGEVKIVEGALQFQADVVLKQLISYAVGCWMGRYRLDQPGLHIAHPNAKAEEIVTYTHAGEQFTIDHDGIIPLLPRESPFDDNLLNRITDFVRIALGADMLTENLNFIEKELGTTIENYLLKEYWKDHKKMYQNRPIYWLWSSKKGAFRVLTYMHRMDAYTAERVRSKYLLPYIEYLQNQIANLDARVAILSTAENRKLDTLRKTVGECREYHDHLQVVAEQAIAFDLDDGVVVNYAKFGDVLMKIK